MDSAKDTLAGGLPHSEIPGSTIARISPGLFAACHVLHRLSVPRHPPDALLFALERHTKRQNSQPTGRKSSRQCSNPLHLKTLRIRHNASPLGLTAQDDASVAYPPRSQLASSPFNQQYPQVEALTPSRESHVFLPSSR